MSKVKHTCSRCGDTVSVHRTQGRQRFALTGGWRKLRLIGLGGSDTTSERDMTLCPTCVRLLRRWVDVGPEHVEPQLWVAEPMDPSMDPDEYPGDPTR